MALKHMCFKDLNIVSFGNLYLLICFCFVHFLIFNICRKPSCVLSTRYLLRHKNIISTSHHTILFLPELDSTEMKKQSK